MKTYLYRASNMKSTIIFLASVSKQKSIEFLAPVKNRRFLRFIHRTNNNNYHFHHHQLLYTGFPEYTEVVTTSLIPVDAILPEIVLLSLVLAVLHGLNGPCEFISCVD